MYFMHVHPSLISCCRHRPHLRHQQSIGVDGANCPAPLPNLSPLEQMLRKWEVHIEKRISNGKSV